MDTERAKRTLGGMVGEMTLPAQSCTSTANTVAELMREEAERLERKAEWMQRREAYIKSLSPEEFAWLALQEQSMAFAWGTEDDYLDEAEIRELVELGQKFIKERDELKKDIEAAGLVIDDN